jgi:hypothetical protein
MKLWWAFCELRDFYGRVAVHGEAVLVIYF